MSFLPNHNLNLIMIILGGNAFQADSSAALVREGVRTVAPEEECCHRVKYWTGVP